MEFSFPTPWKCQLLTVTQSVQEIFRCYKNQSFNSVTGFVSDFNEIHNLYTHFPKTNLNITAAEILNRSDNLFITSDGKVYFKM